MGQAVEQAAAEAVAAAHAVHDVAYLVALGLVELLSVVEAGSPAVPVGALALTESDGYHLHVGVGSQDLVAQGFVLCAVQLAGLHVHVGGDLQGLLHVLLVGDGHVHIVCDLTHDLSGLLAVLPQVLAVVQIAGDGDASLLGFLHGLDAQLHGALGDSGGDAGDVEPIHTFKGLVPVDIAGLCLGDGGVLTVVDNLAGAGVGAGLQEVDAHAALVGADDAAGIHAELAQVLDALVGYGVLGQHGEEGYILAVVSQGDGHVGLAAAEGGLQHGTLEKALQAGGLESEHYFTKGKKLHCNFSLYFYLLG